MCGASDAQKNLQTQQSNFYSTLTDAYKTQFGESQGITNALTRSFTPTLQAGPGQMGYSDGEKTALDTQATEGTAADYAKAQTATAQALGAANGGNQFVPNGANQQIEAQNSTAAAGEEASLKNTVLQNDYAQGRANYDQAASVLGSTAGLLSPTAAAGAATGAGSAAGTTANQIASADNSVWQGALGALGGVAGNVSYSKAAGLGLGG